LGGEAVSDSDAATTTNSARFEYENNQGAPQLPPLRPIWTPNQSGSNQFVIPGQSRHDDDDQALLEGKPNQTGLLGGQLPATPG
jgi:hypothetical protein